MIPLFGLKKVTETEQLVRDFKRLDKQEQKFVAYELSHEWKIATLAASIAMTNQESSVFEIGPCFGFSSIQYSHLIKEKGVDQSKPISKLIAIERKKEYLENARKMREMCGPYVGEIEYVFGDAMVILRRSLKKGDLVFSSTAEPPVIEGILGLSNTTPFNLVISYSDKANGKVKADFGGFFEDLVNPSKYDVFPFEDKQYNTYVAGTGPGQFRKLGTLQLVVPN